MYLATFFLLNILVFQAFIKQLINRLPMIIE